MKTSTKSPSTSSTSINEVGIKSSDNSSPRLSSNSTERWDKKSQSGVAKIVSPSSSLANINGIVSVTASDSTSLESRSHDDSEVVELGRAQSPPAPSRRPIVANKIRPFSVTSTPLDKNLKQEYKSNSARSKSNSVSLNKNNGSNNDGGSFTVGAAQAIQNAGKPSSKVSIIVAPWVEFEDQVVVDGVSSPRLSLARPTISSSSAAKADAPIVTDHNISENFLGDGRASLGSKHSSEKQLQTEALSSSLLAGQSLASAANSSTDIVQATEEPELQRTSVESKRLIATYAVSRSHTFAKFDQTVFQFQLSLSTASNFLSVPKYMTLEQYNSRRSSFKSRIGDSIAVTVIYNGVTNTVKHYLEVPVNSTINEIRMEVLSKHNEASLQETYTITKLEDETSGK